MYMVNLSQQQIDRIIQMAWEDRTPFDAISLQFEISESIVIKIMRSNLKSSSFKCWRKRVYKRKTKHSIRRDFAIGRFKSSKQTFY